VLFGLIAAAAENWLHECLVRWCRRSYHHDAGQVVPGWPDIIPTAYRGKLPPHGIASY
jgi:hypothetical protein